MKNIFSITRHKLILFFIIISVITALFFFFNPTTKNKKVEIFPTIGLSGPIKSLSPVDLPPQCNPIIQKVYEPLVKIEPPFKIVPILAESWDNPTPNQWRFVLKKNVYFQNGAPLLPVDVIYSIKIYKKYSKINLSTIKNIEGFGKRNIIINTLFPDPYLLFKLSNVYIIPHGSKDEVISKPNGTGMYKLKRWKSFSEIEFIKNTSYREKIENLPDKFYVKIFSDVNSLLKDFIKGKLDACCINKIIPLKISDTYRKNIILQPSFSSIYLGIHLDERKFSKMDSLYLKKIFSINISRKKISKTYKNFLIPTFFPIFSGLYNLQEKYILEKTSLKKKNLPKKFNLYYQLNLKNLAYEVKENLKKIGYYAKIKSMNNFSNNNRENYLVLFSYNFYKNGIHSFFSDVCMKKIKGNFVNYGRFNYINFESKRMSNLIINFQKSGNYEDLTSKACEIFNKDYPYIPLFEVNRVILINKKRIDKDFLPF